MGRLRWLWLLLPITGFAVGCRAAPASLPVAEQVSSLLRKALPGYEVVTADPLTLKISKPNQPPDEQLQVNLDRVSDYCTRAPDGCSSMISDFVAKTSAIVRAQDFTPSAAMLRAVVRPEAYVDQLNSLLGAKGGRLVSAPFVGGLAMICYIDRPTAMRPLLTNELGKIGLSAGNVFDVCRANTRAALPKLPTTLPSADSSGGGSIGYINGDPYESSYLLLHDEWTDLAKAFGGKLLVAAPDADAIFYTADTGPISLDALSTLAKSAYGRAERPISSTVFRWTPSGWDVASP